ncbi:MAG: hypothetical protein AB7P76_06095 [Candidatus Melainabacteria bacterium]
MDSSARWYDEQNELAVAVRLMKQLPLEYQSLVCKPVTDLLTMTELTGRNGSELKQMGTERVVGVMKSKTKRRWYDQDPHVHQAFNLLYVMEQHEQQEIACRFLFSMRAMQAYFQKVQGPGAGVSAEDLENTINMAFCTPLDTILEQLAAMGMTVERLEPEHAAEERKQKEHRRFNLVEGRTHVDKINRLRVPEDEDGRLPPEHLAFFPDVPPEKTQPPKADPARAPLQGEPVAEAEMVMPAEKTRQVVDSADGMKIHR